MKLMDYVCKKVIYSNEEEFRQDKEKNYKIINGWQCDEIENVKLKNMKTGKITNAIRVTYYKFMQNKYSL